MTFFNILGTIFIGPLKLLFETIFSIANSMTPHPGYTIVVLSLAMNLLVLPLYKHADELQMQARDKDKSLRRGVQHIKKTFSGDEPMMILQTYSRQNDYSVLSSLKGSLSLFLEIPFFIAAYQFLSHLDSIANVSFGPIAALGAPDGLLSIGGMTINLLPFVMTGVNLLSSAIYLKGFGLKDKIQLYAMALFFLVFLYNSPSALLIYWTLNNVFSLIKNIFYKLKNPRKVLSILCSVLGLAGLALMFTVLKGRFSPRQQVLIYAICIALQLPLLLPKLLAMLPAKGSHPQPDAKTFLLCALFMAVLTGLLIPSTYIAASPQEYIDLNTYYNPLWFIAGAFCFALGTFMVWLQVFYFLSGPGVRVLFEKLTWILCGVMLTDYLFFGRGLGIISADLKFVEGFWLSNQEILINLAVTVLVAAVMYFIYRKWKKLPQWAVSTAAIALCCMSLLNIVEAKSSIDQVDTAALEAHDLPSFRFSKEGKNVVVIMLDRASGELTPHLFNEKPELKEQFDGFIYYSNTISFGGHTNIAAPALFGGYEYTPVEMNRRDTESLSDKHDEALMLMPVLFSQNGYDVTVSDPPLAGYQWIPDLTIYDGYDNIETYLAAGKFSSAEADTAKNRGRNFFCFALMKTMPLLTQETIYSDGTYHLPQSAGQTTEGLYSAHGLNSLFLDGYEMLRSLPSMTEISRDGNNFSVFTNELTHQQNMLQLPDYEISPLVDNTEYENNRADYLTVDGRTLNYETEAQVMSYQANMAAMIQLGNWFDYLREKGVYDNTRIIIVADHGYFSRYFDQFDFDPEDIERYAGKYIPLLMVKDFDSHGFTGSDEFMTNADVPTLAVEGLIDSPTNPFTGKPIDSSEKTAHPQFISGSIDWDIRENNGNTFLPSYWLRVEDDIWDVNNWTQYDTDTVLKENSAP